MASSYKYGNKCLLKKESNYVLCKQRKKGGYNEETWKNNIKDITHCDG